MNGLEVLKFWMSKKAFIGTPGNECTFPGFPFCIQSIDKKWGKLVKNTRTLHFVGLLATTCLIQSAFQIQGFVFSNIDYKVNIIRAEEIPDFVELFPEPIGTHPNESFRQSYHSFEILFTFIGKENGEYLLKCVSGERLKSMVFPEDKTIEKGRAIVEEYVRSNFNDDFGKETIALKILPLEKPILAWFVKIPHPKGQHNHYLFFNASSLTLEFHTRDWLVWDHPNYDQNCGWTPKSPHK